MRQVAAVTTRAGRGSRLLTGTAGGITRAPLTGGRSSARRVVTHLARRRFVGIIGVTRLTGGARNVTFLGAVATRYRARFTR